MAIVEELEALRVKTLAAIEQAVDTAALDEVRVRVVGKSGTLTAYLRNMGQVAKEERATVGKTVNEVRNVVEEALESRKKALAAAEQRYTRACIEWYGTWEEGAVREEISS